MKRGQRKLCDIPCHFAGAVELRARVEANLTAEKIPFEVYSHVTADGADFWRYAVAIGDVRRAKASVPLKLRGFRAVSEGATR